MGVVGFGFRSALVLAFVLLARGSSAEGAAVPQATLADRYAADSAVTPELAFEIAAHEGAVTSIGYTSGGQFLVSIGYDDFHIRLWDASSGRLLDDVEWHARPADLAVRSDTTTLYVVDAEGRVTEWTIDGGRFGDPNSLAGLAGRSARIAVDASGRRAVTTSWDDPAKLWNLETRSYVRALPKSDQMRGVAFSPAGPMVACGSHKDYFAIWNLDRLSWPIGALKKHKVPNAAAQSEVVSVAYSADGRRFATGHLDTSLSIWDMEDGRQMHNWYVHNCSAMDVEFSPCGTVLATAQQDGNVHLWDVETRRGFARLNAHEGSASTVVFDPTAAGTIATGGEDGSIRVWR